MLEHYLTNNLFAFLLVFCRMGSVIMLLPGFGEGYVPVRARLLLGLMISLVITPAVEGHFPIMPGAPLALGLLLAIEITVGVFIGLLSRILISTMHTAGMIVAMQSGLASAMMFDANQGSQGSLFGNFLGMAAVVLLFSLDMHHVMIRGVVASYALFQPEAALPMEDFAQTAANLVSAAFLLGFSFASPHIIVGLIVYLVSGVLSRLMPTMQVFFILMPAQIMVSMLILMISVSAGMLVYMQHFESLLIGFLPPE